MSQNFKPGDYLIFQVESAFGLLRILAIQETDEDTIWHLSAFNEMFLDIETADIALQNTNSLTIRLPHAALTTRAFEATQTSRMKNEPLSEDALSHLKYWESDPDREVSDRSVRLLLGMR